MTQDTVDGHASARTVDAPRPRYHRPNPDLAAALECEHCAAEGISNPPGWREGPRPREDRSHLPTPDPRKRYRPISTRQSALLRSIWARVDEESAGSEPNSRLLALTCVLRGCLKGYTHLVSHDMRILRLEDPYAALLDLTLTGWLDTTPDAVINSDPQHPAVCPLPSLDGNLWQEGTGVRSRASGWVSQSLAHRKMRKKPNRLRLLGTYLAAHAEPDGTIDLPVARAVSACALSGTDEFAELIVWLVRLEWVHAPREVEGHLVARLGEATAHMAPVPPPPSTPPKQAPARTPEDRPVRDRALSLVRGREEEVARWVGRYRRLHRHGPSWATLAEAFGWPPRCAPDDPVTQEAFRMLSEAGWLTGFGVPFGLRPGLGTPVRR